MISLLLVTALESLVISLPVALDGLRERDERRLAECLGERFFRKRARNPAVAVFKRVNGDEIKMDDTGARKGRQYGPRVVEPGDEGLHFYLYGGGWREPQNELSVC